MNLMTGKPQIRHNRILGIAIASALAISANLSFGGVLTIEHVRKDTNGACLPKADGPATLASEMFLLDDPVIFPPFTCGSGADNLDNHGADGPVLNGSYDDGYFYATYHFNEMLGKNGFIAQFTLDNGAQFGKDISLAAGTALDFVAHPSGSHSNVSKESGGIAGDTEVTFYITPIDGFHDLNFDTLFMRFNMKNLGVLKVAGQEIKLGARVYNASMGEFDSITTPVTVVTSVGDTVPPQLPPPQPPPQKLPPTLDLVVGFTGTGHGRITTDPSGIDCDSGKNQTQCSHSFKTATWVKLKAITDADSRFIRWFGNRSDCEDGEVFMSNSAICVAEVQLLPQQLTINVTGQGNVSSIPAGLTCNDQCSHEFNGGEKVTLIATPKVNWQLEKWQGDCDENGQVVLDKDKQCEAVFVKVPCSITPEQYWSSFYPYSPNFGTILVGDSIAVNQNVWFGTNQECGGPLYIDQDKIEVIGDDAAEFQVKDTQCYHYNWQDWWLNQSYSHSHCFFNTLFQPTAAGDKQAQLTFKLLNYEELPMLTVALQAKAVDTGQAQLDFTPTEYDFGTVFIGRGSPQHQSFILKNTGEISLKVDTIDLTGDNTADFSLQSWWCNYRGILHPNDQYNQCYIYAGFNPTTIGQKQTSITATAGNINAEALLTGVAEEPKDCSNANITIESVQSGHWNTASTWSTATLPTTTDVVRINSGHTVTGQAFAQIKTLCVQAGGILKSANKIGTSLEIQATDYLENKGLIQGKDGANQTQSECGKADIGTAGCAQPGASVFLKVGTGFSNYGKMGDWWWNGSGGPILNTGEVIAGKGGDGSQYGAPGGYAIVLGRNTTNTNRIQAGDGGDILGNGIGEGGRGGLTQIWGKLGGPGHLYVQNGAQALAGNGGNCKSPLGQQIGGSGGNLWLVSLPNVHIGGGIIRSGIGGQGCATPSQNGWIMIEPSVISLAGANTQVSGGKVAIYGGNEWTLDLSNLSGTVVEATDTITLAVGKDGIIDFRNSTGQILVAKKVEIFADNLRFDPDKFVSDYIAADNIIIGPSRILRNVSLSVAGKFFGNPGEVFSVPLIVANNGPEPDKYTITATDSDGKILNQLTDVEIEGLNPANLAIDITIPVSNKVIFTAVSQADSEISSTSEVILTTPVISSDDDQVDSDDDITELNGNLPTQGGNQSTPDGNQSTPDGNQSIPDGNQSTQGGNQSTPDGNQPTQGGNQSTPDGDQVTNNDNQPTSENNDVVIVDGAIINPCPVTSDGVIDWTCINKEQTLTDMIFESNAKVSGGQLAGAIDNQGLVSQVTIQPGTVLEGGKLSGYIINHGTLKNFEFVGAQIVGGTLAGQVINNSSIGGTFKDIHLAADAHLIGGYVQGEIQGDPMAPALLENVAIRAGSHLAFVKIGKNVTWSTDVVFEDSVEFIEPTTYCNSTQLTEMIPLLPSLDSIVFGNPSTPPCSQFMGGLSTNGKSFQQQLTVTRAEAVEILGRIAPDLRHVNQVVDLVLSAVYRAVETEPPLYYMVDAQGQILPWDGNVSSLVAFRGQMRLELVQLLRLYHDQIPASGSVAIQFGYRLADGTVILNEPPLEVKVIE
jgi:hypothetical protein